MYRSAPYLEEFHRRCAAAAARFGGDYEIVLVNDGSPDASLALALELRGRDPHVRVVDLSRNFGHHKALMTGLRRASGEMVFLLDCDLEEDPAWLLTFHEAMQQTGADVIYGVQQERKGNWFERVSGDAFYAVFNHLLTHAIPRNVVTARLMTRRYVRALVRHRDQELCLAGVWVMTGFEQRPLTVHKGRRAGSTYSTRKRISVFVNALTSFSNRPLIYIFQIGIGVMLLSVLAGAVLLYRSVTGRIGVPGWASIMVSIWFLGGLMIFCIGVIGIYLAKVFTETKRRPYTVVRADYPAGNQRRKQTADRADDRAGGRADDRADGRAGGRASRLHS
jgi:putative glycosyltransferase